MFTWMLGAAPQLAAPRAQYLRCSSEAQAKVICWSVVGNLRPLPGSRLCSFLFVIVAADRCCSLPSLLSSPNLLLTALPAFPSPHLVHLKSPSARLQNHRDTFVERNVRERLLRRWRRRPRWLPAASARRIWRTAELLAAAAGPWHLSHPHLAVCDKDT